MVQLNTGTVVQSLLKLMSDLFRHSGHKPLWNLDLISRIQLKQLKKKMSIIVKLINESKFYVYIKITKCIH